MTDNAITFAAWLRGRRAEKRLTRDQLADELGISNRKLTSWENEEAEPVFIADIQAMARWARTEPSALMDMLVDIHKDLGDSAA